MTTVLTAFILAFFLSLAMTRLVITFAGRFGILDIPDGNRKTHIRPTPLLGGVAIYIAMLVPILGVIYFPNITAVGKLIPSNQKLWGMLLGSSMALCTGILDDVFDIRARWKFALQLLIGLCMYLFGYKIATIANPFGDTIQLGILALPVTLFWFAACMNAVNLLDGMDGLATGVSLFVGITLFNASLQFNNTIGMLLMGCYCGAVLGFLLFNFPPAKIFLGDSGSLLLGFLIAALSLVGVSAGKAETAVALFIPVIALGIPILDTSMAILRRWFHRMPIASPDKSHIHHKLVSMGYTPRRAVLILYLICVGLGGTALFLTVVKRNEVIILLVGGLLIVIYACIRIFAGVRLRDVMKKLRNDNSQREHWKEVSTRLSHIVMHKPESENLDSIWKLSEDVFDTMHLDSVELKFLKEMPESDRSSYNWKRSDYSPAAQNNDIWSISLTLISKGKKTAQLTAKQSFGDAVILREAGEMLGRIRDALELHI